MLLGCVSFSHAGFVDRSCYESVLAQNLRPANTSLEVTPVGRSLREIDPDQEAQGKIGVVPLAVFAR